MKNNSLEESLIKLNPPDRKLGEVPYSKSGKPFCINLPEVEKYKIFREGEPDLVIVAARPGVGKTSFLLHCLMEISLNKPVLMFSLEMPAGQIKERAESILSGLPISELHHMTAKTRGELNDYWAQSELYIEDKNGYTLNEIYNRALTFHKQKPLAAIGIDYLQIVGLPSGRTKAEEVGYIAEKLKSLAKELNIPVIALAQANRNIEGRKANAGQKTLVEPVMSDLGDSAGIERWADMISFICRPQEDRQRERDFFVIKNRFGSVGRSVLGFIPHITKFHSLHQDSL